MGKPVIDYKELQNSLLLREYLINDKKEDGSPDYSNLYNFATQSLEQNKTVDLVESVQRLVQVLSISETTEFDSEVGIILGTLSTEINIPTVAFNVKYIFDILNKVENAKLSSLTNNEECFIFVLAVTVATTSIITVAARDKNISADDLAQSLLNEYQTALPTPPIFEFHEEPFSPGAYTFDVERIIRLNSEFEDHNIDALRTKSYSKTKDSNLAFADMSRSLASFVWAINRTIDFHKDENFVYDFNRLGTEHIERISRSWGIKEIDLLKETVEEIMKGIGSIYNSEEETYRYVVPSLEGEDYLKFRYTFNVAMSSIASAHVFLFASNFDSTQDGVYGEVRRTIKEVQDSRVTSS